jgi:hypothetical protein
LVREGKYALLSAAPGGLAALVRAVDPQHEQLCIDAMQVR